MNTNPTNEHLCIFCRLRPVLPGRAACADCYIERTDRIESELQVMKTAQTNEHREQAQEMHAADCVWERITSAECEYRDTHHYCPHLEHACSCPIWNPTEAEAEAILRANGTSGKEVTNAFIERLLRERLTFEVGITDFIRDRGRHDGEHVFNLTTCSECDKSYIRAEEALDSLVRPDKHTVASVLSSRDAEIREVLEGLWNSINECWCPTEHQEDNHSTACVAARALYAKLQPKESSDGS